MLKNSLEKYFHKKLNRYQTEIDTDDLWAQIEAKQETGHRSDNDTPWYLMFLLFCLIGCGGLLLPGSKKLSVNTVEANPLFISNDLGLTGASLSRQEEIVEHKNTDFEFATAALSQAFNAPIYEGQIHAGTKTEVHKNIKHVLSPMEISEEPSVSSIVEIAQTPSASTSASKSVSKTVSTTTSNIVKPISKLSTIEAILPAHERSISVVDQLAGIEASPLPYSSNNEADVRLQIVPKKQFRMALDVYGSLDYVQRNLQTKSSEAHNFVQLKEAHEQVLEGWHAGLRWNVQHRKGWSFSTGLEYRQRTEHFKFQGTKQDIVEENDVLLTKLLRADGTFMEERGTAWVLTQIDYNVQTYNAYRSLNLPVLLGYQMQQGHWSIGLQSGLDLNLWFAQKGYALSSNTNRPIDLKDTTVSDGIFKTRTGLSWRSAISIQYELDAKFSLLLEPNFNYNFSSLTVENYLLDQRYNTLGLRLGFRLKL